MNAVATEIRNQKTPEVDWNKVESELFDKIAQQETSRFSEIDEPNTIPMGAWAIAASVLIAIFGWTALGTSADDSANTQLSTTQTPAITAPAVTAPAIAAPAVATPTATAESSELSAGQEFRTEVSAKTFALDGIASWELAPHSVASLIEIGDITRLRLFHGALTATVHPVHRPESFVVEAGQARVAVHGTVFRVELQGTEFHVNVTKGVVSVGPLDSKSTETVAMLHAPTQQQFDLNGRRQAPKNTVSAPTARKSAPVAVRTPAPSTKTFSPPSAVANAAPPTALAKPAPTIRQGRARFAGVVSNCFDRHTRNSGVAIQADTQTKLFINAEGRVYKVLFSPPLAPSVQRCTSQGLSAVAFPKADQGHELSQSVSLGR
ncbi:MAG: FecR domain-containing protein [Polyangiaceae bacterium]|nr:FecR domain-containing protein [Polyangiaceae bacterium]